MARLALFALPAIVIVSALGALALCAMVYLYGFTDVVDDEQPEARARRIVRGRVGHAFAGVCFAVAAILAVVAMSVRVVPRATRLTAPLPAGTADPAGATALVSEIAALRDELRAGLTRLTIEVSALEEHVASLPSSPTAAAPDTEPAASPGRPPAPPKPALATRGTVAAPAPARVRAVPRPAPVADDDASPPPGTGTSLVTTVQGVRIELEAVPVGGEARYTVRLLDAAGQPLRDAAVTLQGRMADGSIVQAALDTGREPGVYRTRLGMSSLGPRDLRLRVVQRDRRFEIALGQPARW